MAEIVSIDQLLKMRLNIPAYQRPYKWTVRNMEELLGDILKAIEVDRYRIDFKYRVGTIILHKNGNVLDIVDGQQRIISLVLLSLYLNDKFQCRILKKHFINKISQTNIHKNFLFIKEWFSLKSDEGKQRYIDALKNVLEVVVIQVNKITEAFQLFDSQNTRGKALDPHDLLKAHHLREMRNYPYEMKHAVTKWEAKDTKRIHDLFDLYLFPIWNWSRRNKSRTFTAKEIDTYKGIGENSVYSYAKRAGKAMPYFQIIEPFIAGNDFFEMVEHYLNLLEDVETEIRKNEYFSKMFEICNTKTYSVGFGYAKNLFYCALLMYYDKFHNFDEMAVKKMFIWAFMIRVDMENLGFDTVNKYAIGEENGRYTNREAMFSRIALARIHTEISSLQIKVLREPDSAQNQKWDELYFALKALNGQ